LGKEVNRTFIIALVLLGGGCTTRLHYEYFEPSGLDSVISMPPQAPKNVATLAWSGCELQVGAEVSKENRIVITLRAFLPPSTHAVFSSDRAKFSVTGAEEEMKLSWQEWTLSNGVGARREVAFDAPLKPQSFAKTPTRLGIEDMGRYETTITLPAHYSDIRYFTFELPPPKGHIKPLRMTFVRRTADYRCFVQLQ